MLASCYPWMVRALLVLAVWPGKASPRAVGERGREVTGKDTLRLPYTPGNVYPGPSSPRGALCPRAAPGRERAQYMVRRSLVGRRVDAGVVPRLPARPGHGGRGGAQGLHSRGDGALRPAHFPAGRGRGGNGGGGGRIGEIYLEGSALEDPVHREAKRMADKELLYVRHQEQEKARADYEGWRKSMLANVRSDYEWARLPREPRGRRRSANLRQSRRGFGSCGDSIRGQDRPSRAGQLRARERLLRHPEQGPPARGKVSLGAGQAASLGWAQVMPGGCARHCRPRPAWALRREE